MSSQRSGRRRGTPSKPASGPGTEKMSEVDKEYMNIQMRSLEQKNAHMLDQMRTLQSRNLEYIDKYNALLEEQTDVVGYLERSLQKRSSDVSELQERLAGLESSATKERNLAQKKMEELKNEMKRTKERLESENKVLRQKLDALEEFRVQRDQLNAKFEKQKKEQQLMREEFEAKVAQMEKQHIIDESRLKQEMKIKMESMEQDFHSSFKSRMASTTQRALDENAALIERTRKLTEKMSDLSEELRKKDEKLKQSERKSKLLRADLQKMNQVAIGRTEVISELVRSCNNLRVELGHAHSFLGDRRRYEERIDALEASLAELEARDEERSKINEERNEQVRDAQEKLNQFNQKHRKRDEALQSAYNSIRRALALTSEELNKEGDVSSEREGVLQQLLTVLNVADGDDVVDRDQMAMDDFDYLQGALGIVPKEDHE